MRDYPDSIGRTPEYRNYLTWFLDKEVTGHPEWIWIETPDLTDMTSTECFSFQITTYIKPRLFWQNHGSIIVKDYIQYIYSMFFVQSANLLHSSMVTMFTQQYPWQRLSTPRDVSIVTDLTHSVYSLVFFVIDAHCACLVTRFVDMVTVLFLVTMATYFSNTATLHHTAWIKKKGLATTEITTLVLRPAQMYKSFSKLPSIGREEVALGRIKSYSVCTYKTMVWTPHYITGDKTMV